jgi:hypothetical protein
VHLISVRHFYLPQIKQFRGMTELTIFPAFAKHTETPGISTLLRFLAGSEHLQDEYEKKTSAFATS